MFLNKKIQNHSFSPDLFQGDIYLPVRWPTLPKDGNEFLEKETLIGFHINRVTS